MSQEEFSENDWRRLIASIGEDPDRPGLLETPARVAKAWKHWTSGYDQDPVKLLKAFEDGAEQYNEFIIVRNIRCTAIASTTWRRSSARPPWATSRTARSSACPS
jgi:GTP cyclohydrolase I